MSVSWGILSTARVNRHVLAAAAESDQFDFIAVASRDAARAEAHARDNRLERAYGSYDELLEDRDLEAVYISLPNSLHVDWTLRALEAGKHVLCEKPLSRVPDEVEEAFDRAESSGRRLAEGFMFRHHPQTRRLAELVADGSIGQLRVVRAAFSFQLAEVHGPDDARFRPELDGGSLMDVGCYCVNAIRLLAGEPRRVQAQQAYGPTGVDVCLAATLACDRDVLAHFDCGFVLPYRAQLEVVGDTGSLLLDDPWHILRPGIELRRARADTELIAVEPADSYRLELENFSEAVRGESSPLLGRDDAVGQARVIEALYRSASAGVAVELEPEPQPTSRASSA
jgi:D-xylose 1-dehydrogenase (NADP+, D-xylono-1,5-lactone-forming)